jgi:type IV pilus assembly protein PilQ
MMSARLSSLLVAGGVVLIGIQSGSLSAATPASESTLRHPVLQGATLALGNDSEVVIKLDIPTFLGAPKLQVLPHPNRVVLDLPGVMRGSILTKKDLATWSSPLIQRTRLAQFVDTPEPVTRLVLEVAEGTQVQVSSCEGGVQLAVRPGSGSIQAKVVPYQMTLSTPASPEVASAPQVGPNIESIPAIESQDVHSLPATPVDLSVKTPAEVLSVDAPKPEPVVASIAQAPRAIEAVPSISKQALPLSNVAISTLLPTTVAMVQEKPLVLVAPAVRREEPRGRTLGEAQGRYSGSRITIDVKGAELSTFLRIIADHAKLNLVADQDVQGIYDFKFTDTPWDQVLDIIVKHAGLGMEINNGVIRVAKTEKLQKEEDDRKKLEEAKALAGDLTTVTRPLSFAKASEVKTIIEKVLSKRGSLIIDDRTNVLIISDLQQKISLIDDLIQQLDIQIQQVQIEARVVEANGNFERAFGVKWPTAATSTSSPSPTNWNTYGQAPSWNSTGGWANPSTGRNVGTAWAANNGIANPAGELWVSFLSNKLSVNVVLQAMETEGKIRIVSNPKIVTQNNKKATILSGRKIPYATTQSGGGGAITVAFADANLQLDVTPQITNDGTIIMDLKIEKSEADFSNQVQNTPTIVRRNIETQVLVRDGGTAVLGGIYTTKTEDSSTGVPFLSKIPILGWLFRTKDKKEDNAELLIFVTPRILKM